MGALNFKKAKCLVTGGAGFIGSHVVEALVSQGARVTVLDNLSTGKQENLLPLLSQIVFVEGDLRDYERVKRCADGVDIIFHIGAIPSVSRSIQEPVATNMVNVGGTLNVLEAARELKVRRVVYASSSSVYGNSPQLPKREETVPSPLSPYSLQKLTGERYCLLYRSLHGLETVCLRYFNVFGPRQDPTSIYSGVVSRFCLAALKGERAVIYGDGEQSRDFTYVENVARGTLLAAQSDSVAGEVLNLAMGERHSVNNLWKIVRGHGDSSMEPDHEPLRQGDVRHSQADISKAQRLLSYKPEVGFEEGLSRTIIWYRSSV